MDSLDLSASLVTYSNAPEDLSQARDCFLNTDLRVRLSVWDNSPDTRLASLFDDPRILYESCPDNLGFGQGHNHAMGKVWQQSQYHLILNPDVQFEPGTLEKLLAYMEAHPEVGGIAPRIVYPDGSLQYSCRLIPTPWEMFMRRLPGMDRFFRERMHRHELRFTGYNKTMEVPFLLGCFLLVRSKILRTLGGFDPRFFMYMEDLDLCRRISRDHPLIYYPEAEVCHAYARGSAKKLKLFRYHFYSMSQYFQKWGWFFDVERNQINARALEKLNSQTEASSPIELEN